jgi:hypothetical protein
VKVRLTLVTADSQYSISLNIMRKDWPFLVASFQLSCLNRGSYAVVMIYSQRLTANIVSSKVQRHFLTHS